MHQNADLLTKRDFVDMVEKARLDCNGHLLELSFRLRDKGVLVNPGRISTWISGRSPSSSMMARVFEALGGDFDSLRLIEDPVTTDGLSRREFARALSALVNSGVTTSEIADKVGTTRRSIQKWISGASLPYWKMCKAYELLKSNGQPPKKKVMVPAKKNRKTTSLSFA